MGVPKFFRWLSERYPKVNQRQTCVADPETHQQYFPGESVPPPLIRPDPLSTCGLAPEIDRLYIDCNGVIHGCSHNNGNAENVTHKDIFRNICYYLDRVISDMVQPKELVYIAIDGVAPRAKLNQQRARRYRGGSEELEQSIYDAFYEEDEDDDQKATNNPGDRLSGKFESSDEEEAAVDGAFHSNCITPGTEFFSECTAHLEHWIQWKLSTDPKWKNIKIVLSGPNVPGEGEHKIMEFMRQERVKPDYNPNLRHAIMGQDADLIMLGLVTHEPNLCIFRERVIFDSHKRTIYADMGLDVYLHNCHFEWLHMSVLRDYLMYEFETTPALPNSDFDRERTIDDFVFLTFFVGNDFLPHLPALDIGDEAFDLIFFTYKNQRHRWRKSGTLDPYLTDKGNIICGRRLENFLQDLGSYEVDYYKDKPITDASTRDRIRKTESKFGRDSSLPPEDVLLSKEESDRARYREMIESLDPSTTPKLDFEPVLSDQNLPTTTVSFQPEEEDLPDGFLSRIGSLLQNSITVDVSRKDVGISASLAFDSVDDQDLKGRYYYDKFQFSPFDADKHRALRKAYIEGLAWNLRYYFQGCASWSWYYPYHYGPMLSDLVRIPELLNEVDFEGEKAGKPLKPFEQLMGCMPPSSSGLLPEPYRWLMTDPTSPLAEFYPRSFTVDMNGKRWPWEATVLLPFLNAKRLLEVTNEHVQPYMLTDAENARNQEKKAVVYSHDPNHKSSVPALPLADEDYFLAFSSTAAAQVHVMPKTRTVFEPKLLDGVQTPSPGFPSLTSAAIHSLWRRRIGTDVHGSRSRYRTALLQTTNRLPVMPPVQALAKALIGTTVYINYPYLLEGYVTAMSNINMTFRGREEPHYHSELGREVWRHTMTALSKKLQLGEGIPGTGGWMLPESSATICVRPLQGITTLPDGTQARVFAKFEVTLPFMAALWSPLTPDPRTENLPIALEEDPFFISAKGGDFDSTVLPPPDLMAVDDVIRDTFGRNDSPLPLSQLFPVSGSESMPPPSKRAFSTTRPFPRRGGRQTRPPGLPQTRSLQTMTHRPQSLIVTSSRIQVKGRGFMGLGVAALVFLGGVIGGTDASPNTMMQAHGILVGPRVVGESLVETPPLKFEHGTTTLSFIFQDGIVAAVDSRASLGNFVGSKTVQKVLPINSHMLGTMAGGAADCSFWIRKVKAEAELFELVNGHRMSVARASRLLSNALYENRGSDLSVGTMIMGFDPDGGPRIYYVDDSGARIEGDLFSVGSGSTFALGILDRERRFDMTQEEAIALGVKAIRHATFRDAYSGGFINVFLITSDGWKKVFSEDIAGSASPLQGARAETSAQEVQDSERL